MKLPYLVGNLGKIKLKQHFQIARIVKDFKEDEGDKILDAIQHVLYISQEEVNKYFTRLGFENFSSHVSPSITFDGKYAKKYKNIHTVIYFFLQKLSHPDKVVFDSELCEQLKL